MWNICKQTAGTHCFLFIFEFALFTYVALCSLFDLAFHWIVRKKNDLGFRPGDHRKTSHPADFRKQDYFFFLVSSSFKIHCVKSIQLRSFFWSVFSIYSVSLRIQSGWGKIQTRKRTYSDTFHAVNTLQTLHN